MNGNLTQAALLARAGARSFERGQGYLNAVTGVEVGDGWVTATVHGTERYEVRLNLDDPRGVSGACDCPYGLEGNFCKHLVALGLTVLAQRDSLPRQREATRQRVQTLDTWLSGLSKDELLALLHEQTDQDRQLRRRLELRAASAHGDLAAVRPRIRDLLDIGPFAQYGYVEYADARAYVTQAMHVTSAIDALTESGRADQAITMAVEAMRLLAEAADSVDDSDGGLGQVGEALADAHLNACRAARPAPEELAHWLAQQALDDFDGITDIDPLDYEDVLGDRGMAALRKLAIEAWRRRRTGWAERSLMQQLARAGGDIDLVIAVHAADPTANGHTHLLIAQELDAAGRPEEAVEWAERGVRDAPDLGAVDTALVDYLSEHYLRSARLAQAVALRCAHFAARRSLLTYQQLRAVARAAECWQDERPQALALLREEAARPTGGGYGGPVLVDALLDDQDDQDDQDDEVAWEAARDVGADDRQWLTLADRVRAIRPADALGVYLRLTEPLLGQTGNAIYERLVGLLVNIRDCHRLLGTQEDFTAYVTALRGAHGRKRNLMRLMEDHGL
ncbi:SWIM zinc finger domain-containing protein [Streptomyces sp. NPDC085900]|uniref:SWIM zinc finger domain-containing protein n=1 Tax=Streptomyces sp. NPDC085900 TaxID=3365737 RepID=UPI0037D1A376